MHMLYKESQRDQITFCLEFEVGVLVISVLVVLPPKEGHILKPVLGYLAGVFFSSNCSFPFPTD